MRRRAVVAGLVAALAVAPTMPAVRAADVHDWVYVEVTAGPSGATDLEILVEESVRFTGPRVLTALGVESPLGPGHTYVVDEAGARSLAVSSTDAAGGIDVKAEPTPTSSERYDTWLSWTQHGQLGPGDTVRVLLFRTDVESTDLQVTVGAAAGGGAVTDQRRGLGSSVIALGESGAAGTAVAAGTAAAGDTTVAFDSSAPIVGALSWCSACRRTVVAPSGATLESTGTRAGGFDPTDFSGGTGAWSIRWVGVTADQPPVLKPVVGVYAPVGDIASLFARPL